MVRPEASCKKITLLCIIGVTALAGTYVFLPLFIEAFNKNGHRSNPYFVTIFNGIVFSIIFAIFSRKNFIGKWEHQKEFIKIGLINSVFFILMLQACSMSRTPVDLQAILNQSITPFMFIASRYIKKESLSKTQIIGAMIVSTGIIISMIPIFKNLKSSTNSSVFVWSLMFLISMAFCSVGNVLMEVVQKKYYGQISTDQLLAWVYIYQLIIALSFFWINFTDKLGDYDSFNEWAREFSYCIKLFFSFTSATLYGTIYVIFHMITCKAILLVFTYATANFAILVCSIATPLSVTFWIIFPNLNSKPLSSLNIVLDYVSVIIILIGIRIFTLNKKVSPGTPILDEIIAGRALNYDLLQESP